MKITISYISHKSLVLNILFSLFFIFLILYSTYLSMNPNLYQQIIGPDWTTQYTIESVSLFSFIHILFIISTITLSLNIVFIINKFLLHKKIYELTKINLMLIIISIIPYCGIIIDSIIFKRSSNSYRDRKLNDVVLNFHFVKSTKITQTIFSLLIFMILNSIVFLIYPQNLFGMISTAYIPFVIGYQSVAGIALLVTVLVGVITLGFDIINIKNIMNLLDLSKRETFRYIFIPWVMTSSRYSNANYFKTV